MTRFLLPTLADALGASCPSGAHALVAEGVSIDSRSLRPGQLFVAIRGGTQDGHAYVSAASRQGMAAAIVDRKGAASLSAEKPLIVVDDTNQALLQVGALARAAHPGPVVGVTGSNGKTTTKELIAAAIASKGTIHKTTGNLNNHYGVPLTLAAWPEDAPIAVIEMGMSALGEIALLAQVAKPDVGVVTCVAPAHLEGLGSIENVARAKSEIFAGLSETGVAVLNDDDETLVPVATPVIGKRPTIRFGHAPSCDVRLVQSRASFARTTDGQLRAELEVQLCVGGHVYAGQIPILGEHNAMNVCAAVACAWSLGVGPEEALRGMAEVRIPGSRALLRPLKGGAARILDDCYNANPGSVAAALQSVAALGPKPIAVLGDMLELGPTSAALHEQTGHAAVEAGVGAVWSVGQFAQDIARGVHAVGGNARAFDEVDALIAQLPAQFEKTDTWLVKGSRGMRLERVVDALLKLDGADARTTSREPIH